MARKNRGKGNAPVKHVQTRDGFVNPRTRTGRGMDNLASAGHYAFRFLTRNRVQLEAAYRGSWIIGNAVDCVAEDMTRAGVELTGSIDPHEASELYAAMSEFGVLESLCDTIKWARLFGGGIGIIMIDGQDPATPLDPSTVGKGQFLGIYSIDRWIVNPEYSDTIHNFGPALGQPNYYQVIPDADAFGGQWIHHSRVIRLDGIRLPMYQRQYENGWGMSVVERIFDVLTSFDSATLGAAQLVYKAHLRVMKIKGYRQVMGGTSEAARRAIQAQLDNIRAYQSNEGMTVIDSEDDFQALQYAFSGLNDVLLQFAQQLAGAMQIPMTRLMGQSPAGFNTGESDLRQYYDGIAQKQEGQLRRGMHTLLEVLHYSILDKAPPEDFGFNFASLWGMSDMDKANVGSTRTSAVVSAYEAGIVTDRAAALRELRSGAEADGMWDSITDEMIEDAESDPPAPDENDLPPVPQPAPNEAAVQYVEPEAERHS
ncbi:phage-associated protein [Komagataeibacter oboediens DSM 11826]|uniref:Anti-CBASS protein Acb1-like N-terminal domain-containing protein n=1 Tax=Komagataeibacter oboediens TaxID=65958 RepID=A0A318QVL7_9PROT|nr:DUF1073 domain-containing protein [Komagataeibacter oboediens]PYD81401.1 hypothetical protein CFR80_11845 [Komagataeibacter oboediens]GBR27593.1 phage-associated protein [Komagataeibacter oboediens DSM 11826]